MQRSDRILAYSNMGIRRNYGLKLRIFTNHPLSVSLGEILFVNMAKKISKKVKLVIPAGKATPAPPVGTNLGPTGINIADFVGKFNAATAEMGNDLVPVEISIYEDRSFGFILKTPPTSSLLLKAVGQESGSGKPNQKKIGKISQSQLREIAEKKMPDLNTDNIEAAMKTVAGTARQMGIEVAR